MIGDAGYVGIPANPSASLLSWLLIGDLRFVDILGGLSAEASLASQPQAGGEQGVAKCQAQLLRDVWEWLRVAARLGLCLHW